MNKYNTRFENDSWVCDCPHFKFRGTDCRHILLKKLEVRGKPEGLRDTSLEAYIELVNDPSVLNDKYQDILFTLLDSDMALTDYEISEKLNFKDPNKIRPRRYELVNKFYKPLVQECKKRICKVTGKKVYAWELTIEGRLLINDILKSKKKHSRQG